MHAGALKKWSLALTFWLALHASSLKAQIFTAPLQASTTGTNPVDFEFRADGTLIAEGNFGVGSLLTADQGAGTRMLWFPSLGSFRVGGVDGSQWDAAYIGQYSTGLGWNTTASGYYAIAMGNGSTASGNNSIALGIASSATESYSVAVGSYAVSTGLSSATFGPSNTATGWNSMALGNWSTASGNGSLTLGGGCVADGVNATAAGQGTTASAYSDFVIGVFNVGGGTSGSWVATDPLFEIGNGSYSGYGNPDATGPSDAFVVYKNGSATLQGTLNVAPGGDIPMYTGE